MTTISNWPFDQRKDTATFSTRSVFERKDFIQTVRHHEEDGYWLFMPFNYRDDDVILVALHEVVGLDSSVEELADLPPGWLAWREKPGAKWTRQKGT